MAPPGGEQAQMPEMPKMPNMWPLLISFIVIFALYGFDHFYIDGWSQKCADGQAHNLGLYLNYVLGFLGFDGKYPVLTLMIVGTVMVLLSSILRTALTDTLTQQKNAAYSSAFNAELREARRTNNMYKVKKLMEMQPEVMAKSMESSGSMMKIMPYTMLIVVPMFLWVRYFVGETLCTAGTLEITVPWFGAAVGTGGGVSLLNMYAMFPAWVLVYSLVSIPIGQFVSRVVRFYQFKKKLSEIEGTHVSTTEAFARSTDVAEEGKKFEFVPDVEEPKQEPPAENLQPLVEEDKQEPPKEGS